MIERLLARFGFVRKSDYLGPPRLATWTQPMPYATGQVVGPELLNAIRDAVRALEEAT